MSIRDVSAARPPTPGIQAQAADVKQKVATAYTHPNNVGDHTTQRFPTYIYDKYMSALSKIMNGTPITAAERNHVTTMEQHTDGALRVLATLGTKPT